MPHSCYVTIDGSGNVTGRSIGPSPTGPLPTNRVEVTQEQYSSIESLRHPGDGVLRYRVVNGVLEEVPDPRPVVRFTPTSMSLLVGAPAGSIEVEAINAQGNRRTGFNAAGKLRLRDKVVRVQFALGVATLTVPTTRAREIRIDSNPDFRVEAPVVIQVEDTEL